jgi:phosphopantothenoylcysteine decarboxylase/phosphopantothenate--cysteine ligase
MIVPAMHPSMWLDPATVSNVQTLRDRGFMVMDPAVGRLTGKDIGPGRFPDTVEIIEKFNLVTGHKQDLKGKKILITAGGTREKIDPVRFIGNRSSGKQGIALAKAALNRGAQVHLIAANCDTSSLDGLHITTVENTAQMRKALEENFDQCDILIMSAAIADATPRNVATEKIKKDQLISIELEPNVDLIGMLSTRKVKTDSHWICRRN